MSNAMHGRLVWYELLTKDPKGAETFYTKVIGWGTQPFTTLDQPYTMWTRGGTPIGGLMQIPEDARKAGAPSHWLLYIGSDDVDATVKRATALGAEVCVAPQDIPNVGRFSVLTDPQGAMFATYKSASNAPMPEAPLEIGDFSWHELATTDHGSALKFYEAVYGWREAGTHDMGPMGIYCMFGLGGRPLGGMFNKPAEMSAPPHWLLYARVDDVNRVAALVKQHGGTVLNGPMEVPGGDWIALCLDPQGAAFAIHQVKATV